MSDPQLSTSNPQSIKRPFSVTLLAGMVLIFTSLSWLRLVEAIRLWPLLVDLPLSIPPMYLALSGLCWGVIGLIMIRGVYWGLPWIQRPMQVTAVAYALYYWFDRLILAQDVVMSARWPFAIGLTLVLLAMTFWTLSRQKVQAYIHRRQA